jgi:cyanophycinase
MTQRWFMLLCVASAALWDGAGSSADEGAVILHGGGSVASAVRDRFLELAGGRNARVLVIPTADPIAPEDDQRLETWRRRELASVALLHAKTREEAESEEFAAPVKQATGVWISGGWQTRLAAMYLRTPVERELANLLSRGGCIAGTSAGAAIQSRVMIVRDEDREGFDLVPHAIIDQHFLARKREQRLWQALSRHPERIGIGVDENTAAIIRGDRLSVLGQSTVSVCVCAYGDQPQRFEQLKAGEEFDLKPLLAEVVKRK